jgi:hypothetical protein
VVQLVPVSLGISSYASVYGFNLSIISMFYQKKTRPILSNMANIRRGPVVQLPFWADPIKLFVNLGRPSGSLVTQLALDPAEFFFLPDPAMALPEKLKTSPTSYFSPRGDEHRLRPHGAANAKIQRTASSGSHPSSSAAAARALALLLRHRSQSC